MDARIHDILWENDSATDVEYQPSFDWQASMAAVKALKSDAEQILGQPLKLDDQVQDASFFAELFVFEDGAVGRRDDDGVQDCHPFLDLRKNGDGPHEFDGVG